MNARKQRANTMMESTGYATQIDHNTFKVRSQTNLEIYYIVSKTGNGLRCDCPDHTTRKADCKHIKIVLQIIMKNKCYKNNKFRMMDRSKLSLCRYCDSGKITKKGFRKNKNGTVQIFKCLDCKRRFTTNFGFEKMRYNNIIITRSLQMYYAGMSIRDIADCLEQEEIEVSYRAVYGWICKYSTMVSKYLNEIVPRTSERVMVRADEVWIKVNGKQNYLFASMDDDTRYWLASDMAETKFQHNADTLLKLTKKTIGRNPVHFVTDGLPAYMKSSKKIFGKDTHHTRHIHLRGDMNNNKMERLNGTIRDREKVFRGLKKMNTPIIDGMKAYYNYTKKHGGLNAKTPAESALIEVDGKNRWKTIIQNASLFQK